MTLRENAGSSPLSAADLTAALVRPGGLWRRVEVVAETGSTNADLLARAAAGGAAGTVLAAEAQHAGKGRLGRTWASAPGAGLTFSVLLRPDGIPAATLGWLPLLTGVAVAAAVREASGVAARLKWPNDVLAGERKLAGILAESRGQAIIVGVGLNVSQRAADLPVPTATSLLLEQPGPAGQARGQLLAAILTALERWYTAWGAVGGDADGCGLRAEYLHRCATVGREVRVLLPGDRAITGQATDVDRLGRLVVRTAAGLTEVSAGDVVHVR